MLVNFIYQYDKWVIYDEAVLYATTPTAGCVREMLDKKIIRSIELLLIKMPFHGYSSCVWNAIKSCVAV